jgi:hypothetical protein
MRTSISRLCGGSFVAATVKLWPAFTEPEHRA